MVVVADLVVEMAEIAAVECKETVVETLVVGLAVVVEMVEIAVVECKETVVETLVVGLAVLLVASLLPTVSNTWLKAAYPA
jgi:hypothetical protein